jgi:hypothetical protein
MAFPGKPKHPLRKKEVEFDVLQTDYNITTHLISLRVTKKVFPF